MMRMRRRHLVSHIVAAGLAVVAGEIATARPGSAEVFLNLRATIDGMLAKIAGEPEKPARDLTLNGQPLRFTPYQSQKSVAELADEWVAALKADTRPLSPAAVDADDALYAAAANGMIAPRVSRVGDDFAVVVRFFDGSGADALAYLRRARSARPASAGSAPMPGLTVTIRRPRGAGTTEVLMSRIDDVKASLAAFAAPADAERLPAPLKPPPGAQVLTDLGDQGRGHTSRTVIASGAISAARWAEQRMSLLGREGFSVERGAPGANGVTALHARRGPVEADILYTRGAAPGETVEIIEIRQPLVEGKMP